MRRRLHIEAAADGVSRRRFDARIRALDGAAATGFGIKLVDGKPTGEKAFVVYTRRKVPLSKLRAENRIPPFLTLNGKRIATDVVTVSRLLAQSWRGRPITDGASEGTLAAFARRGNEYFGLSCAHAIWGLNQSVPDDDPVSFWDESMLAWRGLGAASHALLDYGLAELPEFGVLDAGLIALEDPNAIARAKAGAPVRVWLPTDVFALVGKEVVGIGAAMGARAGFVAAACVRDVSGSGFDADLVVMDPLGEGLTFPGDSGTLWLDKGGSAIGMHTLGDEQPIGYPSKITVASFASRIVKRLGITLLA